MLLLLVVPPRSNINYISNCDKTAAQRVLLIGFSVLSKLVIPFTPPGDPQKTNNVRPSHLSIMLSAPPVVGLTKRRIQKNMQQITKKKKKQKEKTRGETTTST